MSQGPIAGRSSATTGPRILTVPLQKTVATRSRQNWFHTAVDDRDVSREVTEL